MFRVPSLSASPAENILVSPARDRRVIQCKLGDPCYICFNPLRRSGIRTRSGTVLQTFPGNLCQECGSWVCIPCSRRAFQYTSGAAPSGVLSRCGVCRSRRFVAWSTLKSQNGSFPTLIPWVSVEHKQRTRIRRSTYYNNDSIRVAPNDRRIFRVQRRRDRHLGCIEYLRNSMFVAFHSASRGTNRLCQSIRNMCCIRLPEYIDVSVWTHFARDYTPCIFILLHIIFTFIWTPVVLSLYSGRVQLPGCPNVYPGQQRYTLMNETGIIPNEEQYMHDHSDYTFSPIFNDSNHTYVPPSRIMSSVLVVLGMPGMHAAVDVSIMFGPDTWRHIRLRWISSGVAFLVLMLCSAWVALGPIIDGKAQCSAEMNTRVIAFSHCIAMSLYTVLR